MTRTDANTPNAGKAGANGGTGKDAVLEHNVERMLESYDPPRLDAAARVRLRERVVRAHARDAAASSRAPVVAIGLGLAAAAAIAIVAGAVIRGDAPGGQTTGNLTTLADGSTVLLDDGASLDVLGPRRVRVRGAALLDVKPGQGAFTVETAQGRLAVLGTRFVIDAEPVRTFAAVIRGVVRLETATGQVELHAGEQGVAEPGRPPSRGPAPRLSHLASWARQARARAEDKDVQPARNGTLFAREPGVRAGQVFSDQEFPLPMSQLTVDAVIDNQVARVALDQTFENPQPRELEGVYRFAIPSDAALQRFAMYVDGKLTESAVVERMRARRIYEELVYHRIDPGLLEWAGAGRLSLRIYPLRAKADKRIVLAYTQSLPRLYDDWTMTVPLPEVDSAVDDVAFNVRVKGCGGCELHSPSHRVEIGRDGDDAVVSYHARGERIGDSLVLVARDTRRVTRVASYAAGDHRYLVVRARPDLGAVRGGDHRARSWVIVDDVSASRGPLERRAQADVIDGLLHELDEDDRVAVVTMDSIVREHGPLTRVDDVDARAVRAFLTAPDVGGVGATDLGRALDRATAILAGVDPRDAFVVYVGDGVVTTGSEFKIAGLRDQLVGKATFVGVGIGDGVDTPTLAALADATGGSVYTMDLADDLRWRTFDLVASLYTSRVTGLAASLVDGRGQVVAAAAYLRAGQLGDGEELELVARVPANAEVAAIELAGQQDGAPWQRRLELAGAARGDGAYLPRLWAQRHVAALLLAKEDAVVVPPCAAPQTCQTEDQVKAAHRETIRKQVVELGTRFFLLSRHTSLLVLENDAMYKQYGVTKGAGDTWAPYAVPPTVAVKEVATVAATAGVDPDATLVRTPIQRFYRYPAAQARWGDSLGDDLDGRFWDRQGMLGNVGGKAAEDRRSRNRGDDGDLGGGLMLETAAREQAQVRGPIARHSVDLVTTPPVGGAASGADVDNEESFDFAADLSSVPTSAAAQVTTESLARAQETWVVGHGSGTGRGFGSADGHLGRRHGGWAGAGAPYPIALNHPGDQRLDDLSELVPALFPGAVEATEADLVAAGGGVAGSVDAAARALIERARAALPVGTYRLGDGPSITVGAGGSLAWRTVDDNGLEELARFDGGRWRRAYPELGLEVVRELGGRAPALALTVMPLLVADADHLAAWFVVTARGNTLSLASAGARRALLAIELDAKHRVTAIRTAAGTELLAVTWGAHGPVAATVAGAPVSIGFTTTAEPIAIPTDLAAVVLPLAQAAKARDAVARHATGTAAWQAAQRQVLAVSAAVGDPGAAAAAFEALLADGGVRLGDFVLAGGGLAAANAATFDRAAAAFGADPLRRPAPVRYLAAARAYRAQARPDKLVPGTDTGLVGTLWRYRQVLALISADQREAAVAALEAMGPRGADLRLIAATLVAQRWNWPVALIGRAWDSVARGELRNIARYEAARALANRGDHAAAADRFAALLADFDLAAAPVQIDYTLASAMQSSPRGQAGFEMAWRGYVARVIADGGVDHVVALAASAGQLGRTAEADQALGRVTELAGTDRERLIDVLGLAMSLGQHERAAAILPTVLAGDPDPTVLRLAAQLALAQGRPAEAADHLERAMAAGAGPTPLAAVRADYQQLIALRGRVAQLAIGPDRDRTVDALLAAIRRWRAIDPANQQIDAQAGELLLQLGRTDEALRQLATAIEREPMEGAGWILVAGTLERHGRYDDALATWHQAMVIDQTNPGPRLRLAQLYYAMGRSDDGDAIVKAANARTWHSRFSTEAWQLQDLARQRKLAATPK